MLVHPTLVSNGSFLGITGRNEAFVPMIHFEGTPFRVSRALLAFLVSVFPLSWHHLLKVGLSSFSSQGR